MSITRKELVSDVEKHLRALIAELSVMQIEAKDCINEKAHFAQFYRGRIQEVEREIAWMEGLLEQA